MAEKPDLDKAWDGLTLDSLDWSCGCGQSRILHQVEQRGLDPVLLVCLVCGPVARLRIQLDPIPETT